VPYLCFYLNLLKAEMRFPPPRKKGVFQFQFFLRVVGKTSPLSKDPNFVQIMPQERSLLKSTKSFSKAKSKSAGYFFHNPSSLDSAEK